MKRVLITSALLLSIAALTGCSEKNEVVQETNKITEGEVISAVTESFKVVGDSVNGFIKIPEEFSFTPYNGMPEEVYPMYSNPEGDFTVQFAISDLITTFDEAKHRFTVHYEEEGKTVETESTTIAGFEAVEMHAYIEGEDTHEFSYFIQGEESFKVIMFKFEGANHSQLKEDILSTFSEKEIK